MTTPPCEHVLAIDSAGEPDARGRRWVHLVCSEGCGYSVDTLTMKTDAELAEEQAKTNAAVAAAEAAQRAAPQ